MKAIILALIFILFSNEAYCQNYYVLKVEGNISLNEVILKKGDQLPPDAQITFSNANDKLFLLSPKKGYKLLSPSLNKKERKNELVMAIRQAVLPKNKNYLTASRGNFDLLLTEFDDIYDMMAFFRDRVIIADVNVFPLNAEYFSEINVDSYFEMTVSGAETLVRKLNVVDGNLIIPGIGLDSKSKEFRLNYIKGNDRISIGAFEPVFLGKSELNDLISPFLEKSEIQDPIALEQAMYFLDDRYGKVHKATLEEVVKLEN